MKPTNHFSLHFDGGCIHQSRNGYGSYEILFNGFSKKASRIQFKAKAHNLAAITNNSAEYLALEAACEWLQSVKQPETYSVMIHGDSSLVINQVLGYWKCKQPHLKAHCQRIRVLLQDFHWTAKWEGRANNVLRFGH